jgi:hypothetical protein
MSIPDGTELLARPNSLGIFDLVAQTIEHPNTNQKVEARAPPSAFSI